MNIDYDKCKAEDLISDDYFIHSVYFPTARSIKFWDNLLKNHILDPKEYELAKLYLESVTVESEFMEQAEMDALLKKIETTAFIGDKVHRKTNFYKYSVAATIAVLLLSSMLLFYYKGSQSDLLVNMATSLKHIKGTENIELVLSDEKRIPIHESDVSIQYVEEGDIKVNEKMLQKTELPDKEDKEQKFNQLIVPAGKRSTLTFSDGTQMWVNAGTRVIYPVEFEKNKREIYVDGEVYLEVSPDKNRPFYVKTSDMQIAVLGTSFNVMSYESDKVHAVVLVRGLVKVKSKGNEDSLLNPNEIYTKENEEIQIKQVDVSNYVLWKEGIYKFEDEALGSILLRLSRYYNVKIKMDRFAAALLCSGKLEFKEDISRVLKGLTETAPVSFQVEENGDYYFMYNPEKYDIKK